jgi:hypothetical protein
MKDNQSQIDLTKIKTDLEKKIADSKANLTTFGSKIASNVKVVLDNELADLENQLEAINQKILSANGGGGKRKSKRTKSSKSNKSNKSKKSKRTRK